LVDFTRSVTFAKCPIEESSARYDQRFIRPDQHHIVDNASIFRTLELLDIPDQDVFDHFLKAIPNHTGESTIVISQYRSGLQIDYPADSCRLSLGSDGSVSSLSRVSGREFKQSRGSSAQSMRRSITALLRYNAKSTPER